jgi:hypothetical protein
MAFPTTQVPTTHLDAGSDSPSSARADLLLAVQSLNTIIDEANTANGVLVLDNTAQVPGANLPSVIAPVTGTLTLAPVSGRVKIEDVLRLQQIPTSVVLGLSDIAEGDIVYTPNGANGSPCLAVYNGTNWLRIALGAAISAT